jgi:hypothetical protein
VWATDEGGVLADLTQSAARIRPTTPEKIKPFLNSVSSPIGKSSRHYGLRQNEPRDANTVYGRRNVYEDSAETCLKPGANADKINTLAADNAEKNYLSNKREPLGHGPTPVYALPDKLLRDGFGIPSEKSENAKVVIYSCADKEAKLLHPPGEQTQRNYDWAKVRIDPTNHRFGAASSSTADTTKDLLHPQHRTVILPKIVGDYNGVASPELSKSKNFGFGGRAQGAEFTYGKTQVPNVYDARQLISGAGVDPHVADDDCLGHTFTKSHTLRKLRAADAASGTNRFGGTERSFGVPSIRSDLPKPQASKVTNGVNYGDDVGAKDLIYPSHYIRTGVDPRYFVDGKTLDEVKDYSRKSTST